MPMKYFFNAIDYVTGIEDGLTHRSGYERQPSAVHATTVGLSAPRLSWSQRFSVTTITLQCVRGRRSGKRGSALVTPFQAQG
jgi:hypothetical protein